MWFAVKLYIYIWHGRRVEKKMERKIGKDMRRDKREREVGSREERGHKKGWAMENGLGKAISTQ